MQFLTGGIAREPFWQIRSDSGADSIVWMGEEYFFCMDLVSLEFFYFRDFLCSIGKTGFWVVISSSMEKHIHFMKRALELAGQGWGKTNPNPLVGAVIVKDGEILGEGHHERLGQAHAEVAAFNNAVKAVDGGTLYVNLEPCSHYGRTPPCARAIIEAGISEVVVGMEDPNPKVSGNGIRMLKEAGIKVTVGVLEEEARRLNEIFVKYIAEKKPFVILKAAITLDGKIATAQGDSRWISGEESRRQVHRLRDRVAAVMVGINTVLADNPALTVRLPDGKGWNPARVIVDSRGRIPLDSRVLDPEDGAKVLLATTEGLPGEKERLLKDRGVQIIKTGGTDGRVDLPALMEELYRLEMDSVLLEGGGGLNAAALESGIVDKVLFFIAPKIIGGSRAKTAVEGEGISLMRDAHLLKGVNVSMVGGDVLMEGYI